ncbi:hypothetical protein [Burkholderia aenigmatica]|uniref:Uncharacterized protein n=1 Tax=Burkholderia aenigmatica TaxID=2015348 RepID=A0A228HI75_9BURK|nr:hypothetical protein [Burkholderia aenigmatica]OXI29585.1 hypothetical protein CFB84_43655 [Burkholderia aenigmatica]
MAVSFGLAKKIIEHPSYNLGLALPFVAAFYLLNDQTPVVLPLLDYALGNQLSMALKILGVAFYYAVFLFFFVLAGGFSYLTASSKLYYAYPIMIVAVSIFSLATQEGVPRFFLFFGALAIGFLALSRVDNGNISLLLVGTIGGVMSLLSFVAGVLWFEGHLVFSSAIAALFGFATLSPESLKLGWPMLVTVGYVTFYAVFQTSEIWSDITA